jgi:transcriptional regulator with XRE-family HTH domain
MIIGDRLRAIRERRKLSQEELEDRSGLLSAHSGWPVIPELGAGAMITSHKLTRRGLSGSPRHAPC